MLEETLDEELLLLLTVTDSQTIANGPRICRNVQKGLIIVQLLFLKLVHDADP